MDTLLAILNFHFFFPFPSLKNLYKALKPCKSGIGNLFHLQARMTQLRSEANGWGLGPDLLLMTVIPIVAQNEYLWAVLIPATECCWSSTNAGQNWWFYKSQVATPWCRWSIHYITFSFPLPPPPPYISTLSELFPSHIKICHLIFRTADKLCKLYAWM